MYYGRENWVSRQVGDTFLGYYDGNSDYSKSIKNLIVATWGLCPPFDASIVGNSFSGTLKIIFFNEFDPRTITPEKMKTLVDAMKAATADYEIAAEKFGPKMLIVSYRKK